MYSSDLRIRVSTTGLATYPAAAVVCGPVETDPSNPDTVLNHGVPVEVQSPSTIDDDLGEKFDHYKQAAAVRAVLYVWQDGRQIELRERLEIDSWRVGMFGRGQIILIEGLECRVDVDALCTDAGGP